jgi:C1A family cysteine protease
MAKSLLVVLALFVAVSFATSEWDQFEAFITKYEKKYATEQEKLYRFSVFQHALVMIEKMNLDHMAQGGEAVFGINSLADLTREEFTSTRLMTKLSYNAPDLTPITAAPAPQVDVDWRLNGTVTAVKDQGQCGSCWAHSADEAMESFDMIYYKRSSPYVLSVQQCTACTYDYNGCDGGWPKDAYTAAIQNRNGIDLNSDYPYSIPEAGVCKFGKGNADKPITDNKGYKSVARGGLEDSLTTLGPVSVCVAAEAWQYYTNGVLSSCPGSVDHCVQAVGYTSSASTPYWVVRNSWGTSWGVKGYIYLDMTVNNGDICHIQEYITYPTFS